MLTEQEQKLIAKLAEVYNDFHFIMGFSPTRSGDMTEAASYIHILQDMVLAQAAARYYPEKYRLLGGVISG